jgi:hypothetical protein
MQILQENGLRHYRHAQHNRHLPFSTACPAEFSGCSAKYAVGRNRLYLGCAEAYSVFNGSVVAAQSGKRKRKGIIMFEALAVIFGVVVIACASLMLLPFALVLGILFLVFSGLAVGAELVIGILVAVAAVIACVVFLHLLLPILIPVLLIMGIVFVVKHLYHAVA